MKKLLYILLFVPLALFGQDTIVYCSDNNAENYNSFFDYTYELWAQSPFNPDNYSSSFDCNYNLYGYNMISSTKRVLLYYKNNPVHENIGSFDHDANLEIDDLLLLIEQR